MRMCMHGLQVKDLAMSSTPRQSASKSTLSLAEELHMIDQVCKSHELFQRHAKLQLSKLLPKMQRMELRLGDTLFSLGDTGSSMYILLSGELTGFARDRIEVKVFKPGTAHFSTLIGSRSWQVMAVHGRHIHRYNFGRTCSAQAEQRANTYNQSKEHCGGVQPLGGRFGAIAHRPA